MAHHPTSTGEAASIGAALDEDSEERTSIQRAYFHDPHGPSHPELGELLESIHRAPEAAYLSGFLAAALLTVLPACIFWGWHGLIAALIMGRIGGVMERRAAARNTIQVYERGFVVTRGQVQTEVHFSELGHIEAPTPYRPHSIRVVRRAGRGIPARINIERIVFPHAYPAVTARLASHLDDYRESSLTDT